MYLYVCLWSFQTVIAAQCFHWFANAASISEINRILTPLGKFSRYTCLNIWFINESIPSILKVLLKLIKVKSVCCTSYVYKRAWLLINKVLNLIDTLVVVLWSWKFLFFNNCQLCLCQILGYVSVIRAFWVINLVMIKKYMHAKCKNIL